MGAGASTALGTLTRAQVAEKTRSTRDVLDFIFHYLMEDIHIRDFYRLSSPDECKRYILILANRIHENFLSLDIVPSRTKTGKLYYRSVHDHVSPPTEAEKVERQTLCVVLAFFYVRIFQIFGALALTLVDDATAMPRVARGIARVFETGPAGAAKPAVGRVGDVPVPFRGRPGLGARFIGGATDKPNLGPFQFIPLRSYDAQEGPDGRKYYVINTATYTVAVQAPASLLAAPPSSARLLVYLQKPVTLSGKTIKYAIATMKMSPRGGEGYQLRFENDLTVQSTLVPRLSELKADMGFATIEREGLSGYMATVDETVYKGSEIGRIFDIFGERLEKFLRARREGREEELYYKADRRPVIGVGGLDADHRAAYRRPGLPAPLLADEKVPQGMRMSSLYHALTVTRPLPTCVARAIQLLTTMPTGGMGPALSSVCDKGFFVEDGNKLRAGTVRPGESIETSPGEMALVQLFYDTVSKTTRDSLEQSPGALKDYTTFMKAMAAVYGSFPGTAPADFAAVKPSEIKDKAMATVCAKLMEGKTEAGLDLPPAVASSLIPYVQQLLRQQLAHAAAAGKIISKLFLIETKGGVRQIRLNPKLLDGGFPALEVITAETRQLLTAYYAKCEETYREGVKTMFKGLEAGKAAAAAAAPPAAPGAGAGAEAGAGAGAVPRPKAAAALFAGEKAAAAGAPTPGLLPAAPLKKPVLPAAAALRMKEMAAAAGAAADALPTKEEAITATAVAPKRMTKAMVKAAEEDAVLADLRARYPPLTPEERAKLRPENAIRYNALAMDSEEFKRAHLNTLPPAPPRPAIPVAAAPTVLPGPPKRPEDLVKRVVIEEKKGRR